MKISKSKQVERPSCKIVIKLVDKLDHPIDYQDAWDQLQAALKNHPYLEIFQSQIYPDLSNEE